MRRCSWHISVLIPARNEEHLLPRCLYSIQQARRSLPVTVTSDVVVVSDCSQDRTRKVAEAILKDSGLVLETASGIVGSARAMAAAAAVERYRGPLDRCWLANTDADCEVPKDWLVSHLNFAERGLKAVAGIIDVDSFVEHRQCVEERFRLTYLIRGDGTHSHVHGANLGVRADAYLAVGGWSQMPSAEDHDLWSRLDHEGHMRVSDATLKVITSGRRVGRAPSGFAEALAAHNEIAA
jgi:cellulose synthase/poly-beta-1,6-N-acetylglucosamine synthase-like glycosyltransferase